jgi:folate-binding protein YgfZ
VTPQAPGYFEIPDTGFISFTGDDAAAFLHAQLTSDVAGLRAPATQYSGYCSAKGRLLATFLVWRLEEEILLQLPASLREAVQTRLARYVLRAKVTIADATPRYALFGAAGDGAAAALSRQFEYVPASIHQVSRAGDLRVTAIPIDRYVLLVPAERAGETRSSLEAVFQKRGGDDWTALDVTAGIPLITAATQDEYVPQMVNLDLVGGVSFSKGCYPGQEIVARMHYLGRLKQRLYRIRVDGARSLAAGQSLYSAEFGSEQASGAILYPGARDERGVEALAVVQKASAGANDVRYLALDGPRLEFLPLPYTLPE